MGEIFVNDAMYINFLRIPNMIISQYMFSSTVHVHNNLVDGHTTRWQQCLLGCVYLI